MKFNYRILTLSLTFLVAPLSLAQQRSGGSIFTYESGPNRESEQQTSGQRTSQRAFGGILGEINEQRIGEAHIARGSLGFQDREQLTIGLPSGKQLEIQLSKLEIYENGQYTWVGETADGTGYAILVVDGTNLTGKIVGEGERYSVHTLDIGVYAVVDLSKGKPMLDEPEEFEEGATNVTLDQSVQSLSGPVTGTFVNDDGTVIRVLTAYTRDAATLATSIGQNIRSIIRLGIEEANLANARSGVSFRFEIVNIISVGAEETGNEDGDGNNLDVRRLSARNDGIFDEVFGPREIFAADLVMLMVNYRQFASTNSRIPCGVAREIDSDANTAFAIADARCTVEQITYAHEMGHLFGGRHQTCENRVSRGCDNTNDPFSYVHGYWRSQFQTVMSVADSPRVLNWSNPSKNYDGRGGTTQGNGLSTGTTDGNNVARLLNQRRTSIANFRKSRFIADNNVVGIGEGSDTFGPVYYELAKDSRQFVVDGNGSSGGNVTLRAGGSITMYPGFEVRRGGRFAAIVVEPDPGITPSATVLAEADLKLRSSDETLAEATTEGADLPTSFELSQNYPNPFNPSTLIGYALPTDSHVTIKVYDMLGREVATLIDSYEKAGRGSVAWDAGTVFPSGVYFYRLDADNFSAVGKMTLLK